jgi:hypothetical protein
MSKSFLTALFFSFLLWSSSSSFAQDKNKKEDQCFACHINIGTPQAESFQKDIHRLRGISCAGCHGGDPNATEMEDAMSPEKGYIGVPKPADIPKVCGACHMGVPANFEAGVHGKALRDSQEGPQCVSCHGIHNIVPVHNTASPVHPLNVSKTCSSCHGNAQYMKKFNPSLPVDQFEKYLTSVHGQRISSGDTKAATCVSCHSNHLVYAVKDPRSPVYATNIPKTCSGCHSDKVYMSKYDIPKNQYEEYSKSVHGVALLQKGDLSAPACNSCHGNHGAAPPEVETVANVCGVCHSANSELFAQSPHKEIFDQMNAPGCVACHNHHLVMSPTDAMIGFDPNSNCGNCHNSSDSAAGVIKKVRQTLDKLTEGQKQAVALLNRAEQLGMDVSEAKYSLKDANQSLVESRVKIHAFKLQPVLDTAGPGLKVIDQAKRAAGEAIQEYHFRRKGLGVSTLILTVLVITLYFKIRQIEARQRTEGEQNHSR